PKFRLAVGNGESGLVPVDSPVREMPRQQKRHAFFRARLEHRAEGECAVPGAPFPARRVIPDGLKRSVVRKVVPEGVEVIPFHGGTCGRVERGKGQRAVEGEIGRQAAIGHRNRHQPWAPHERVDVVTKCKELDAVDFALSVPPDEVLKAREYRRTTLHRSRAFSLALEYDGW